MRSITKKVSFKNQQETSRKDSTSSCSSSDDSLNCVEDLNNSVLEAYISDKDPDFVPTSAEIAQAEADEEKASLEIEESIAEIEIAEIKIAQAEIEIAEIEIAQVEADEEKTSLEIEERIAEIEESIADKALEQVNKDLVVAGELSEANLAQYLSEEDPDYRPTQVERELAEENNQLQNSSCDDEPTTGSHRC